MGKMIWMLEFQRLQGRLIGGVAVAIFLAISASTAMSQDLPCRFDLNGHWTFDQANGYVVRMDLKLSRKQITGTAQYTNGKKGIVRGTVKGACVFAKNPWLNHDTMNLEVTWPYGVGTYSSTIDDALDHYHMNGRTSLKGGNPNESTTYSVEENVHLRK